MADLRLGRINIVFTENRVMISEGAGGKRGSETEVSGAHLQIEVHPTGDGCDIASIDLKYYNPSGTPARLYQKIDDPCLFQAITYSIIGDGETFVERIRKYMRTLSPEDAAIIVKEYSIYIEDGIILDGFVAGVAAYLGFIILIESNILTQRLPFQFALPVSLDSGNVLNRNMMQYVALPLTALTKSMTGVILQFITFIQSFINMWEPAFAPGPCISPTSETRMCIEIMSGFTQHVLGLLQETRGQNHEIILSMQEIEDRLHTHTNTTITRMKREIANLTADARAAIKNLDIKRDSLHSLPLPHNYNNSCNHNGISNSSSGGETSIIYKLNNESSGYNDESVVHQLISEGSMEHRHGASAAREGSELYKLGASDGTSEASILQQSGVSDGTSEASKIYGLVSEGSVYNEDSVVHQLISDRSEVFQLGTNAASESSIIYKAGSESSSYNNGNGDDSVVHQLISDRSEVFQLGASAAREGSEVYHLKSEGSTRHHPHSEGSEVYHLKSEGSTRHHPYSEGSEVYHLKSEESQIGHSEDSKLGLSEGSVVHQLNSENSEVFHLDGNSGNHSRGLKYKGGRDHNKNYKGDWDHNKNYKEDRGPKYSLEGRDWNKNQGESQSRGYNSSDHSGECRGKGDCNGDHSSDHSGECRGKGDCNGDHSSDHSGECRGEGDCNGDHSSDRSGECRGGYDSDRIGEWKGDRCDSGTIRRIVEEMIYESITPQLSTILDRLQNLEQEVQTLSTKLDACCPGSNLPKLCPGISTVKSIDPQGAPVIAHVARPWNRRRTPAPRGAAAPPGHLI